MKSPVLACWISDSNTAFGNSVKAALATLQGRDMVNGFMPNDLAIAGKLISDVYYQNARDYFPVDVSE